MSFTDQIVRFVENARFDDVPDSVKKKAKLAFLDWIGVVLGGSTHESSRLLFETLREFSGPGQASVLGFGKRRDIFQAALLNGHFSHVLDYDDIHLGMIGHPSIPVFPCLLALSEWRKKSGKDFLLAFILGVEIECRLGETVNPEHYDRGWHSTSTLGHFGSAVGASKLLRLNSERTIHAIGIAGTQACGLRQVFGTMCKPLHAGKAAENGLMAAILAEKGFTSSKEMIGGEKGFTSVLSGKFDPFPLTHRLGETWKVEEIIFKRHASCYRTHAVIECCLALRPQVIAQLEKIDSLRLRIPPLAWDMAGILFPRNGLEGKFSQPFCAAVALLEGKAMDGQFTPKQLGNPLLQDLLKKAKVAIDAKLTTTEAAVDICLQDGMVVCEQIDTEKVRLGDEEILPALKEKFQNLVALGGLAESQGIIGSIFDLERLPDMEEFTDRLRNASKNK